MIDLNTLILSGSGVQLVVAVDINNRGEIVGSGAPPGCDDVGTCGHAFLIIPCVNPFLGPTMSRMRRRIIVYIATSAHGFIARSDGSVDWLDRPQPKGNYGMGVFYKSIDTILWGRKTCDMALDFQKKGVPGSAFDTRVKNYVFTGGPLLPSDAPEGVQFVNERIKPFTEHLREQKGKHIWMMGGAGIIASFLDEGEIDEFIIHLIPAFIGEGIPLIRPARRTLPLKLISCTKFPDGVVKLHYAIRK